MKIFIIVYIDLLNKISALRILKRKISHERIIETLKARTRFKNKRETKELKRSIKSSFLNHMKNSNIK